MKPSLQVNWKVRGFHKNQFFDRKLVENQLRRDEHRKLWKIGRFLRTRSRAMLRRRKRVSKPGQSPSVRASSRQFATLKNILYYYDADTRSVIIGPRFVNGTRPVNSNAVSVPQLLELGGHQQIEEYISPDDGEWSVGVTPGRRRAFETRKRVARYEPRPFMGPALDKEIAAGTLAGLYVER